MTDPAGGEPAAPDRALEPHHHADRAWEYENGFYLTSPVERLGKALAQYELYKKIVHLPGSVVECGVYKGASLVRLLTFREVLERANSRAVVAFDAFGDFPRSGDADDQGFIEQFEGSGGPGYPEAELRHYLAAKGFSNLELVAGDVFTTVPEFLGRTPQLRISLLHLDMDVYEPTAFVLEQVGDRVVAGGIIMVDDYGTVAGATRAVDAFCARTGYRVQKLPLAHIPAFVQL